MRTRNTTPTNPKLVWMSVFLLGVILATVVNSDWVIAKAIGGLSVMLGIISLASLLVESLKKECQHSADDQEE